MHAGSEGVGSGTETTVVDLEDGLEEEDAAGLECAPDIIHELVVVSVHLGAASCGANAGLARVPESLASNALDAAVRQAVTQDLEDIAQVRSTWGLLHKAGAQVPQQGREEKVENGGNQVGGPILCSVSVCMRQSTMDNRRTPTSLAR